MTPTRLVTTVLLLGTVVLTGAVVVLPRTLVQAAKTTATDGVTMDAVVIGACGTQTLTFSGSAAYSEKTQHLLASLDGTPLLHSHSEPKTWQTGPTSVSSGTHTLVAEIADRPSHVNPVATQTVAFTIAACGQATTPLASPSGSSSSAEEETPVLPKKKPSKRQKIAQRKRVFGAAQARTLFRDLMPLNRIFRSVYGRNPSAQEWGYWARRMLTDRSSPSALQGAMRWHRARGETTGRP